MTDIVERLREHRMTTDWQVAVSEAHEAADEIERLRAVLEPFAEMGKVMMGRRHHMEAVIQYGLAPTVKVHHLTAAHEARAALWREKVK